MPCRFECRGLMKTLVSCFQDGGWSGEPAGDERAARVFYCLLLQPRRSHQVRSPINCLEGIDWSSEEVSIRASCFSVWTVKFVSCAFCQEPQEVFAFPDQSNEKVMIVSFSDRCALLSASTLTQWAATHWWLRRSRHGTTRASSSSGPWISSVTNSSPRPCRRPTVPNRKCQRSSHVFRPREWSGVESGIIVLVVARTPTPPPIALPVPCACPKPGLPLHRRYTNLIAAGSLFWLCSFPKSS